MKRNTVVIAAALAGMVLAAAARADIVTDWNANLSAAVRAAGLLAGAQPRQGAVVQAIVFDTVNGFDRQYEPYLVRHRAPHHASVEAAVAQAAYAGLVALFPAQKPTFDNELAASLAGIAGSAHSIAEGREWGTHVANAILTLRSTDGYNSPGTPYYGGTAPGVWRAVPPAPAGAAAVLPQMATMTPFALASPSQFRPGPPPALSSTQYASDVNEVKDLGSATSTTRTAEQGNIAKLWAAFNTADFNDLVRRLLPAGASLVDESRILALSNIAAADGIINVFDAKNTYNFWRPYSAIRLAASAGNPAVTPDPNWMPLVATPNHQEYPSAHATVTGAGLQMLSLLLGDDNPALITAGGFPSFTYTYPSFSTAMLGVQNARVWAGIHYRTSVSVGARDGIAVADYIYYHIMRPLEHRGDEGD